MDAALDQLPLALRAEIDEIPTLPAVVSACLDELHDPSSNAQRVADLMLADVGLTARALKLVNSSLFALSREVTSLSHAIALLGSARLEEIILSVTLPQLFGKGPSGGLVKRIWEHSFATAFMAREIAVRAGCARPADAYVAGLMHDMGLMVAARCLPTPMREFLKEAGDEPLWNLAAEHDALGADHTEVGVALADHWGFPDEVRESIHHHHAPTGHGDTVAIVHVADLCAEISGLAVREIEPEVVEWLDPTACCHEVFPSSLSIPDDLDLLAGSADWASQVRALVRELVPNG